MDVGFIAQEVGTAVPEEMHEAFVKDVGDDEGHLALAYPKLTAVLTGALQEQQAIIDRQGRTVAALKGRLGVVEASLVSLEELRG